jgi:citrate lyase beta subunit
MQRGHTRIIAMVEDAQGLACIHEIASAHPRVIGLIVGVAIEAILGNVHLTTFKPFDIVIIKIPF